MTFKVGDRVRTTALPPGIHADVHAVGSLGTVVDVIVGSSADHITVSFDDKTHGFMRRTTTMGEQSGCWHCLSDGLEHVIEVTPEEALTGLDEILEDA